MITKFYTHVKINNAKKLYDIFSYINRLVKEEFIKNKSVCPFCDSSNIIKYGKYKDTKQRYRCKECKKTFSSYTNTIFSYSKKEIKQWIDYMKCMAEKLTIRSSASKIKISNTTSFYWRHKILKLFRDCMSEKLSDVVEIKTAYSNESFKGRKRSLSELLNKGSEPARICTIFCVDRSGGIFSKVVSFGSISYKKVEENLKDKLCRKPVLCFDNNMAYVGFAKRYGYEYYKITYNKQVINEKYHLFNALEFIREVNSLIHRFRGVATKYLNFYIAWIKMLKLSHKNKTNEKIEKLVQIFSKKIVFRIYGFKMIGRLG